MIVMQVIGGLGNQMFQYATGRALSLSAGTELKLFLGDYKGYELHSGYELDKVFNLDVDIVSETELQKIIGWRKIERVRKVLQKKRLSKLGLQWLRGNRFVVEPELAWWAGVSSIPEDCYLVGYWQSEKYFKQVIDVIKSDFTFQKPLSGLNEDLAVKINSCNSVSLHVRRGDYVSNSKTLSVHGLCSLDYYRRAIDYIAARVDSPEYFIFSDDITWVRDNLNIPFPCNFISHNTAQESSNDMRLMSNCRYNIIANSSFSWWGAWLNENTDKIVVAPRKWLVTDRFDYSDLVPSEWIKL